MLKTLVKNIVEVRLETKDDVSKYHKEIDGVAKQEGAVLTSWKENRKDIKEKGEIVETFYIVSYTLVFEENIKEPEGGNFDKMDYVYVSTTPQEPEEKGEEEIWDE